MRGEYRICFGVFIQRGWAVTGEHLVPWYIPCMKTPRAVKEDWFDAKQGRGARMYPAS
jgi:hypothetical protein